MVLMSTIHILYKIRNDYLNLIRSEKFKKNGNLKLLLLYLHEFIPALLLCTSKMPCRKANDC